MKKPTAKNKIAVLSILLSLILCINLTACSKKTEADKKALGAISFQITEEANPEIKMENQPISSFWFPSQLLEWNAAEDKDLPYNISRVPLAERVDKEKLTPVNQTQNKDTKIVSLSIMNSSTSGNPSRGSSRFESNTFTYWQYIDMLVYWGGSSGEGLIIPPSPDVTDAAHRNGVPVLGTIFFPQAEHGGKIEWLDDFLQKDSSGSFPMIDKLIEVASTYGFDGWFINQESQGTPEAPLTKEHAVLMQEFILKLKEKAGDSLEIMWYDSMTKEGKMDWQNALTDENAPFMINESGKPMADSMFLNFWWNENAQAEETLADAAVSEDDSDWVKAQKDLTSKELLKASKAKAQELGIDPYSLYAGVDVQANGYNTPIRWDLFEDGAGSTFTSLGLYCPSWTYFSTDLMDDFERNEKSLWVNAKGNPALDHEAEGTTWRGISTYAIEKTVLNKIPFVTNFNTGNGYNFFLGGEKVSDRDWNNRSMTDVLPTYRFIIENEGSNKLNPSLNYADAYFGGNSIKLRGNLEKDKNSVIKLYSSDLTIEKEMLFTVAAKATADSDLSAVLTLEDGSTEVLKGDKSVGKDWTVVAFDLKKLDQKVVRAISFQISSKETLDDYEISLGNMTLTKEEFNQETALSSAVVEGTLFDDENMYAGVRLTFEPSSEEVPNHYEVYRLNSDETRSLLGVTTSPTFFVNALERSGDSLKTEFEIIPVNKNYVRGTGAKASMEWPDNSLPKADFKASHTLVAPDEPITFESVSSQNTTELSWSFEGGEPAVSTDASPAVIYKAEGTYKVSLSAKNEKGEDIKEIDALITVSKEAAGGLVNLSQDKTAEATAYVNDNEAPPFALDGKTETKWCATGTPPHEITIDLGEEKTVSEVAIAHAEAGGESPDMNTQKYIISVSTDGSEFTEVVSVTKNSAANTLDSFPAAKARYVKLSVTKPTQGSDTAARIYEVQVFGAK